MKSEEMSNIEIQMPWAEFDNTLNSFWISEIRSLGFVSSFGFRDSDFA